MDDQLLPGMAKAAQEAPASSTAVDARLEAAHQALAEVEEAVTSARAKANENLTGWLAAAAGESLAQAERTRDRAVLDVEQAAEEAAAAVKPNAATTSEADTGAGQDGPQLLFGTSERFLHELLLPMYIRIIDSRNGTWCRKWFLHAEALSRVDALWRAWEHLRLDGKTGMSVWWKDHADPHMAVLLNQKGPFHACDLERHKDPDPLPCDTAPPGWFPEEGDIPFP